MDISKLAMLLEPNGAIERKVFGKGKMGQMLSGYSPNQATFNIVQAHRGKSRNPYGDHFADPMDIFKIQQGV